jgi:hypothetical protein
MEKKHWPALPPSPPPPVDENGRLILNACTGGLGDLNLPGAWDAFIASAQASGAGCELGGARDGE